MAKANTSVLSPNLGLYFDRPFLDIPPGGLSDGMNFRVYNKRLNNFNLGRAKFSTNWTLGAKTLGIENFFLRGGTEHLLFLTAMDVFVYNAGGDTVSFLTPRYETGTVAVTNGSKIVTGTGTSWSANAKHGDMIYVGATGQVDPTAAWATVDTVDSDTQITLTANYAGATASGQSYTLRQVFSTADDGTWVSTVFINDGDTGDDQFIATNGVDFPISWNGIADQMTVHTELGFTCTSITTYKNMVIYDEITDSGTYYPTSFINSEPGFPFHAGDNVTDPLSISSQFQVHDGIDRIMRAIPLGDNLVFYSASHVVLAQFVGGDTIFIFRSSIWDFGPLGPKAIADFGDHHEYIGPNTEYLFDGVSVHAIATHVMRNLTLAFDPIRLNQTFAHFDGSYGDLIWSTPLTTDSGAGTAGAIAEVAYVEHYLEDIPTNTPIPFSARSFKFTATGFYERAEGITWADAARTWADANFAWNDQFSSLAAPLNLGGDDTGQIWIFGQNQNDNGVGLPSYVHFGRRATGSGRERNLLRRIYPYASLIPAETLTVNAYFADHANGDASLLGSMDFDENLVEGGHFVSIFHTGRFFEVEFAKADGGAWEVAGYDVDVSAGGMR